MPMLFDTEADYSQRFSDAESGRSAIDWEAGSYYSFIRPRDKADFPQRSSDGEIA